MRFGTQLTLQRAPGIVHRVSAPLPKQAPGKLLYYRCRRYGHAWSLHFTKERQASVSTAGSK